MTGPATASPEGRRPAAAVPPDEVDPLPDGPDGLLCSARGCTDVADYDLQWNNPKIHTPDRRKHWLACGEHRPSLADYLSARGLLRDVLPLDPASPSGAGPA